MKHFVIPVIIWSMEIIAKRLKMYVETVLGKHPVDSFEETPVLGTSHMIRKVLLSEI
jgi:hypothetical protein